MPGLIKIGFTKRSPEQRRRELSQPSGIPIEFEIAYEIFSSDILKLEKSVHSELEHTRLNSNREFFCIELNEAITIIRHKADEQRLEAAFKSNGINELFDSYEAIEILGRLKEKFGEMIRMNILSARIYQTKQHCYHEVTQQKGFHSKGSFILTDDLVINRSNLNFIGDFDDTKEEEEAVIYMFDPTNPVTYNARIFVDEMDPYSIIMCGDDLFTPAAIEEICEKHRKRFFSTDDMK
ncbi:GIY-YIG nuclease family protein [Chitinophaga sp. sic0106]|nr:GIY-YIG nuclease family protein [Chitinophaga sp. sic0106]